MAQYPWNAIHSGMNILEFYWDSVCKSHLITIGHLRTLVSLLGQVKDVLHSLNLDKIIRGENSVDDYLIQSWA